MKNAVKYNFGLIFFVFTFSSCGILFSKKKNYDYDNLIDHCNFITITDTFSLKIIEYIPAGFDCGQRTSSSVTDGVNIKGDTMRVLSMCNLDTTYHVGMKVIITPTFKSDFFLSLPHIIQQKNIKKTNTIFGTLKKCL